MSATVLVGLQWGDEGKGKIIDFLTEKSEVVVRFQGGSNAGHTVEIGEEQFILHLMPSGILHPGTLCLVGNGVVLNPLTLHDEIQQLTERGIDVGDRLLISDRCQLVFEYHCLLDGLSEQKLGKNKIGTTKRGIGPAYADKVNRIGIRAALMRKPKLLEERIRERIEVCNQALADAGADQLDPDCEWAKIASLAESLAPFVTDVVLALNQAVSDGKEILFEGAQGTWLDIDFGTYPFVTSSNTTAGAACTGTGFPPGRVDRVIGVVKAYCTRVGSGPFPTELEGEVGEELREVGAEFGATTGRPRRCGWFDAVATRYAVMLNGADAVALTKLDVLDHRETLKICTAYELDGKRITDMPADRLDLSRVVPVYEEMPGWQQSTTEVSAYDDLPVRARGYIDRLMELIGTELAIVSVGPRRSQTIAVGDG